MIVIKRYAVYSIEITLLYWFAFKQTMFLCSVKDTDTLKGVMTDTRVYRVASLL